MKKIICFIGAVIFILSCSACNLRTENSQDVVKECSHNWSEWTETVKPTCEKAGEKTRECINCSKQETKTLEKLSHKDSDWIVDAVSTSTQSGKRHIECVYCKKLVREEKIPKISSDHTHKSSYFSVIKEPTCIAEGEKRHFCSCGASLKTETISAKGHSPVKDKAVQVTCENPGLTEGKHCSVCNMVLVEQTVIPQKEHVYGPWRIILQPTETREGMIHKACINCALGIDQTVPALKDTDPSQLNQFLYDLRSDGYWITGVISWVNPILEIPSTYNGKPVVGIAEKAFYKNSVIEQAIIPASVKNCGAYAFGNCTSLKKATLPNSLENISGGMFNGCKALTEVNLPVSLKSIGSNAFRYCEKLSFDNVTLECSIGYDAFNGVGFKTLTYKGKTLTDGLRNAGIKKLVIAEGVETIEKEALMGSAIGEISFPTTLKTIKHGALYGVGVEKLVLRSPVHFEYGAFNNCRMKEIVIPAGSTFDKCVFMNCKYLETVYFGGTRAEWNLFVSKYGMTAEDYNYIKGLKAVCVDD